LPSKPGTGDGHGKLILTGEHAVVYGHPAIAVGITTKTTVTVASHQGPSELVADQTDAKLHEVLGALCPTDCRVSVTSELPIGRGMGSSAALSVALVRALADANGRQLSQAEVYSGAMAAERIFHSNPSGLDAMVSSRGGVLYFKKGETPLHEQLEVPKWGIIVLDSGETGSTATMVEQVAERRPAIDPLLTEIGQITEAAKTVLHDPHQVGELLTTNHRLLREIGVSTQTLDELTALALEAGATGAKLSGAGGGGVVIAVAENAEYVLSRVRARGAEAFACTIWSPE
jgi:mevalonate kinase